MLTGDQQPALSCPACAYKIVVPSTAVEQLAAKVAYTEHLAIHLIGEKMPGPTRVQKS